MVSSPPDGQASEIPRSRGDWPAVLLALALPSALCLPQALSAAAVLVLALGWFVASGRPARERWVSAALLITGSILLASTLRSASEPRDEQHWLAEAERRYAAIWSDLEARADSAAARFPGELLVRMSARDAEPAARREAFSILDTLPLTGAAASLPGARHALTVVDADGEALAWSGTGLLNEPPAVEIVRSGVQVRASATAVTLLVVRPLEAHSRAIRLVVGLSLPSDRLPFEVTSREEDTPWSLLDESALASPSSASSAPAVLRLPGRPALLISRVPSPPSRPSAGRFAWLMAGLTLSLLALARLLEQLRGAATWPSTMVSAVVLAMATLCVAVGCGASAAVVATLCLGAGLLVPALREPTEVHAAPARGGGVALALGAGAVMGLVLLGLCHVLLRPRSVLDLGSDLPGSADELLLRLAIALIACALGLVLVPRSAHAAAAGRWSTAAWGLLLVAVGLVDHGVAGPLAVIAAAAAAGGWITTRGRSSALARVASVFVVSAVLSAVAWEVSYHARMKKHLATELMPRMAPLEDGEIAALEAEVEQFLRELDLSALTHRPLAGMDLRDLAFAVWKRSPLAHRFATSALALRGDDGPSLFSFGLPFRADSVGVPTGYEELLETADTGIPGWPALSGEVPLRSAGREWGAARWWLRPRPGYRLRETAPAEQVLIDLLRGTPSDGTAPSGLPRSVLFALYPPRGGALISPWQERPPLPPEIASALSDPATESETPSPRVVTTPTGSAWAFFARRSDGIAVLFLPRLSYVQSAERVGTIASSAILLLAAVTLLALVAILPGAAVRDLVLRNLRSYSRRLLIVFASLLVVPLLLLNLVLLRTVRSSLEREQRSRGEQALTAAHRAVQEQVFSSGELGFAIHTALGAEFLQRIGRLVNHDVNVYHRAEHLSSSTSELFTAGLLPRRIPGDVFSSLTFGGTGIAARTSQVRDTPYLELYTPVLDPDPASGGEQEARIFLSVPLLAQQENAEQVLAALARRALVASTALLLLLAAIGGRLARGFTRPISELVEGTRRIAAGAGRLELTPTELELAALVSAIDDMAGRIARGRDELLREKAIVERVVDNITAGVISLDGNGRVLMHNRAARELLGVSVGRHLLETDSERNDAGAPAEASGDTASGQRKRIAELVEAASTSADPAPRRETMRWGDSEDGAREWTVVHVPLPGEGEPAALLVLEDVTEAFRGQRLAAWAEMARIIAHEIKNPLTPVRLSAEHMRMVFERDPEHFAEVFDRCTSNILRQVDELQRIATEFSTYSRIPDIELREQDLRPALDTLVEAYRAAPPPGIEVRLLLPSEACVARFDERLLARALRNLLENAVRACGRSGVVEVRLEASDREAVLTVADTGPGVAPENVSRIFEPYFSTHDTGTGLGLPISRRIVEEHGGTVNARNRAGGGLAVEIRIPLA